MNEMQEIYRRVAEEFAVRINIIFESEASLEVEFKKRLGLLPFSRTDHWQAILYHNLRECWLEKGPEVKSEPTGFDRASVLKELHLLLDYNLFSQVLLNLQTYNGMAYQSGDATKALTKLKEDWENQSKLKGWNMNPFAEGARMLKVRGESQTEEETAYNLAVSTARSLKTISNFTPMISFRVSPKGKTPAFADSNNLSMLGIGADRYLRVMPQLEVYYLVWQPGTTPVMADAICADAQGTSFKAPGIPYEFVSKSGGEVLHDALFARYLMYQIFGAIDVTKTILTLLPRMNSLLVITDKQNTQVTDLFKVLWQKFPQLGIQEKSRITPDVEPLKEVKPGGIYEHFKGGRYHVIGVGKHTEDQSEYVVYEALGPAPYQLWVRPAEMFKEVVCKNGVWQTRFRLVEK